MLVKVDLTCSFVRLCLSRRERNWKINGGAQKGKLPFNLIFFPIPLRISQVFLCILLPGLMFPWLCVSFQEVSEYGFVYGSKWWKSQFSVDSQLRTQLWREGDPPKKPPTQIKRVCTNSLCKLFCVCFLLISKGKGGQFVQTVPKLFAQIVCANCFYLGGSPSLQTKKATASKLFSKGISLSEYGSEGFSCLLRWKTNMGNTGRTVLGHRPIFAFWIISAHLPKNVLLTVVFFLRSWYWDPSFVMCTLRKLCRWQENPKHRSAPINQESPKQSLSKPNQREGQNEKFMNFAHFCEFWCLSLGKQARFTFNFCSGMPQWKVHELTYLWFGLPGPLLNKPNSEMFSKLWDCLSTSSTGPDRNPDWGIWGWGWGYTFDPLRRSCRWANFNWLVSVGGHISFLKHGSWSSDSAFVVLRFALRDWRPLVRHSFHLRNGVRESKSWPGLLNGSDWQLGDSAHQRLEFQQRDDLQFSVETVAMQRVSQPLQAISLSKSEGLRTWFWRDHPGRFCSSARFARPLWLCRASVYKRLLCFWVLSLLSLLLFDHFPLRGGKKSTQNKKSSEQVFLNKVCCVPDSDNRGAGRSLREVFAKVRVNAVFFVFPDLEWGFGPLFSPFLFFEVPLFLRVFLHEAWRLCCLQALKSGRKTIV